MMSPNSDVFSALPFSPESDEHLDVSALETWLWDAACVVRGVLDAHKYKDFIERRALVHALVWKEHVVQALACPLIV